MAALVSVLNRIFLALLLLCTVPVTAAVRCESQRVALQVLGSGGPELTDNRASSGYLLTLDGKARLLVDAGAGSARQFEQSGVDFADINAILLTHLHADHVSDLPAYVKGGDFTSARGQLAVLGPAGNKLMPPTTVFLQRLFGPQGAYAYLSDHLDGSVGERFSLAGTDVPLDGEQHHFTIESSIGLTAVNVHHGPIAAIAWRVEMAGCVLVFSGDSSNRTGHLAKLSQGADILVAHQAIAQAQSGVARNLHMLPSEIGKLAATADVGEVVLSHLMARSTGQEQQSPEVIGRHYSGPVRFAEDGMVLHPRPRQQKSLFR